MIHKVLALIAAHRDRTSKRLLDVIYGPEAKAIRQACACKMQDKLVTGSHPSVQYGNLRLALIAAVGAQGNCKAAEDADFEKLAAELLAEPVTDTAHSEEL